MINLIDNLVNDKWLKTERIIQAFRKIKRADFLPVSPAGGPEDKKDLAELNEALPIGYNQTISQPLVVAFMLELLQPDIGDKILDVGSGSGWTTALLAELVGEQGRVIAIELIPELMEFGKSNTAKYNFVEKGIAKFVCVDGSKGYAQEAPFDKILASAAGKGLPGAWKEQLRIGGKVVMPIDSSIWLFEKKSQDELTAEEYPGFTFVPLIEETQ